MNLTAGFMDASGTPALGLAQRSYVVHERQLDRCPDQGLTSGL